MLESQKLSCTNDKVKPLLDISANRRATKYTLRENLLRVVWQLVSPLFRLSLRTSFRWRAWLLRLLGAKVGKNVHIYPSVRIYFPWNLEIGDESAIGEDVLVYNLGKVVIGSRTTISHRAHLCAGTHDYRDSTLPLLKPPIFIANDVWICADAFIGPGVSVADGAIVGARAVVFKNIDPLQIVIGNPAVVVKTRPFQLKGNSEEAR